MADAHNHGPEGGFFATDLPDITCPERRMPDGTLRGACLDDAPTPSAEDREAEFVWHEAHGPVLDDERYMPVTIARGLAARQPAPVEQSQYGLDLASAVREARARGEVSRG